MPEFDVQPLLQSATAAVHDVCCRGECRHRSTEESTASTRLVFPYRGLYLRHVGSTQSVADANHVLFFNADEGYRVSHPVAGGDACLSLIVSPPLLRELAPAAMLQRRDQPVFRHQALRIDERAQVLVALLRHSLRHGGIEPLEGESLALTLVCRSLGPRTAHAPGATRARQRLVDRAKLLLASDLTRRWALADIAAEVGGSPVYLTQAFQQVEGMPLYRYHLRLRLARALDRVADCEDVAALALDLGFSSHSHFSAAFRQAYGRTPTAFRRAALNRAS
ncbi:AraC family transcriptional regulator [Rhodanobacter denitrificans]|uniref:AraC family transcriptional regulator n=1 Tax=Rhodanobacter denitrificans TaxID=666685 RepID=A0A368KH71_9GAMM|nr:AraC family transcriptional regulator [Rhodanobacter denitrificans]RCS30518.1 AraC family transcriptional regulator [Rhodanobacter denitrificans]